MLVINRNFYPSHVIYFALCAIILPVYLFILMCLIRIRKKRHFKTTFYELLRQHSIADVSALSFFNIQKLIVFCFPLFLYEHQNLPIASVFFNGIWWFIVIRSHGIALLTLHRYLVIVKCNLKFTQSIQRCKPWIIGSVYWLPPILFNLFVFFEANIQFEGVEHLMTIARQNVTDKNTKVITFFLLASCAICTFSYLSIGYFLHIKTKNHSISKLLWREFRLALQVLLLLVALLIFLVFMALLNVFANNGNDAALSYTRGFTPLVNGLLSFISPITILFFNQELAHQIKLFACGQSSKEGHQHEVSSTNQSLNSMWMSKWNRVRIFTRRSRPEHLRRPSAAVKTI